MSNNTYSDAGPPSMTLVIPVQLVWCALVSYFLTGYIMTHLIIPFTQWWIRSLIVWYAPRSLKSAYSLCYNDNLKPWPPDPDRTNGLHLFAGRRLSGLPWFDYRNDRVYTVDRNPLLQPDMVCEIVDDTSLEWLPNATFDCIAVHTCLCCVRPILYRHAARVLAHLARSLKQEGRILIQHFSMWKDGHCPVTPTVVDALHLLLFSPTKYAPFNDKTRWADYTLFVYDPDRSTSSTGLSQTDDAKLHTVKSPSSDVKTNVTQ